MGERIERYWRIFATGLCFFCFGIGGLLVRLLIYPCLLLLVRRSAMRTAAARHLVHVFFRLFVRMMTVLGVISYEVRGQLRLARHGLLVVANHPSLIDVVFLIALVDRADCLVKGALARNPFTRGPILAAGYICNNTGEGMLEECIASVRAGNNLIIFPEGTRTPLQGPVKMQRGAANIAVRGEIDLTPVHIFCSQPLLTKGSKWYRVPSRRPHLLIDVAEDIRVTDFMAEGQAAALAVRRLTDHLAVYFSWETHRAES